MNFFMNILSTDQNINPLKTTSFSFKPEKKKLHAKLMLDKSYIKQKSNFRAYTNNHAYMGKTARKGQFMSNQTDGEGK